MRTLADIKKMVDREPNDQALGEAVRKFVKTTDTRHFRICVKCGRWQSDLNSECKYCGVKLNMSFNED